MKILEGIKSLVSGGLLKEAGDLVGKFVTTKEDKVKLDMALKEVEHKFEVEATKLAFEADKEFNQRIKDLEGTAGDLQKSGWLGKIIIFLRGAQRPIWGYSVMFLDFKVFSGTWDLSDKQALDSCFWMINILVLGFLFGERAIKNVMPIIKNYIGKK